MSSSGFSEFLNGPLRAPNLAWQPTALPDQPFAFVNTPAATNFDATQVPLPDPKLEGLRAIRHYFIKNGRYTYEGRAGSGSYGSVYILRQVNGNQGSPNVGRRIAAKMIRRFRDPEYCDDPPVEEVEALEAFAGAAHVVRTLGFKTLGGIDLYGVRQWVLLEYLEGGTFRNFAERVTKRRNGLPNRMLWSILRCSTAMAYTEQTKDQPVQLEMPMDGPHPQSVLYNTDMHTNNCELENTPKQRFWTRDDAWDLASENLISMASSVLLGLFITNQPPFGDTRPDPELEELLDVCTRRGGTMRDKGWSFRDVDDRVQQGFMKDPEHYRETLGIENGTEEDEAIVAVVRELFLDAETSQESPSGATDMDDLPNPLLHPDDSDLSL
ncbi:uncharacterized protein PG998_006116 [Apiospora kogelbergensis]|uniref:uncharacterized protein n=1 Tax=Apiospora kogelbergensis TaxID=1337665 RepID=UPI003130A06D